MLRLRLSSNFSFESFTVTWMCNTQEKGGKGIFINHIMYFLELFQGKYFRQTQSHQLYQMYRSWMISIKYTSPVIFFLKFLASPSLKNYRKPWKISPDFQNTMLNIGLVTSKDHETKLSQEFELTFLQNKCWIWMAPKLAW